MAAAAAAPEFTRRKLSGHVCLGRAPLPDRRGWTWRRGREAGPLRCRWPPRPTSRGWPSRPTSRNHHRRRHANSDIWLLEHFAPHPLRGRAGFASKPLRRLCESVRKKPLRAHACVRFSATSVGTGLVCPRVPAYFNSLRGWRSQDRGGSSPPFRTNIESSGTPAPRLAHAAPLALRGSLRSVRGIRSQQADAPQPDRYGAQRRSRSASALHRSQGLRYRGRAIRLAGHDTIGYLPVLKSWMQSPSFLKV